LPAQHHDQIRDPRTDPTAAEPCPAARLVRPARRALVVRLTPRSLFAFGKVSLLHAVTSIEGIAGRLPVIPISRTTSPVV
jgi:hypothetical protein